MKPFSLLTILLLVFVSNLCFSQELKKITLNVGYQVYPEDVTAGNPKTVGYTITTTSIMQKFGLFDIDYSNNITNSKSFGVTNTWIELVKIAPEEFPAVNNRYILARYLEPSGKWSPVIVEINPSTGSANWAKKINIPNLNLYSDFTPVDIVFDNYNLCILAVGNSYGGSSGVTSPISKMLVIDFNLSTFSYTIDELYDPNELKNVYTDISFIRFYHSGIIMYTKLSISGLLHEHPGNFCKGFTFEEDFSGSQNFKSYTLNSKSINGFQVNGFADNTLCTHIGIQNVDNDLTIFRPIDVYNSVTWQADYNNSDHKFFLSNYSHGVKQTLTYPNLKDFFVGYYGPFSAINKGYGFLRFDATNGVIDQNFYYDSKVEYLFKMRNTYDYGIDECATVAPGIQSFSSTPFIYLILKPLSAPQEHCTLDMRFDRTQNRLDEYNQTVWKDHYGPYNPTSITLIEDNVVATLFDICTDPISDDGDHGKLNSKPGIKASSNSNMFLFTSESKSVTQIQLYTIDGKLIQRKYFGNSLNAILDSKTANTGIYIAKIFYSDGSVESVKILKKNY